MKTALQTLKTHLRQIHLLKSTYSLLNWDQQVFMPTGASHARGMQMATLLGIIHDYETSEKLGEILQELTQNYETITDKVDRELVLLASEDYVRATKVPKELVEEKAKLTTEGYNVWVKAKQEDDFKSFAPVLQKIVDVTREIAKNIDSEKDPYDVCIQEFDRGMSCAVIDPHFARIKEQLKILMKHIKDRKKRVGPFPRDVLKGNFDINKQARIYRKIAEKMGFEFQNGRMDTSPHPFTVGIDYTDVRFTIKYKEDDYLQPLLATMHEVGHSLYEQGINKDWHGTPVGKPQGMSLHESQSLLWERHVGQSKAFWKYIFPHIQKTFAIDSNFTAFHAYRAVNEVKPSFIRVEADEVTYPMHIILRYEIEKDLIHNKIDVGILPEVWNAKMKEYLGKEPKQHSKGALQDVHWASGCFGYFPSYLCGAMLAAQIYNTANKQIPKLEEKIEKGNFEELKVWLNKNIHEKGSLYTIDELMKQVTGEPMSPEHLLNYLTTKYSELYIF